MNDSIELKHVEETLKSGWLAPGKKCEALEKELTELSGHSKGLVVNSRASAEFLGMISCGITKGSEVIVFDISVEPIHLKILEQSIHATIKHLPVMKENISELIPTLKTIITPNTQALIIGNFTPYETLINLNEINQLYPNLEIISDFPMNHSKVSNQIASISITDISGICSVILFKDESKYQRAIGIRDWGRVGTQSENVSDRYNGWVLGNGVRYDYKFVYGDLGFNFKTCDLAASLALDAFHKSLTN